MKNFVNKFLTLILFSFFTLFSQVGAVPKFFIEVYNKTGKDINFKVLKKWMNGKEEWYEKKDIGNNKKRTILHSSGCIMKGLQVSIRKSWKIDPKAKLKPIHYYLDKEFVKKVRCTLRRKGKRHVEFEVKVYTRKSGEKNYVKKYKRKFDRDI